MKTSINILLIEDDADDIELLKKALEDNNVQSRVTEITRGDRVLPYIDALETLPDVIVLDLNMPRVPGKDILQKIKSTERLAGVPVVVLTTSIAVEDRDLAHRLGATDFVTKPTTLDGFNKTVGIICSAARDTHRLAFET